MKLLPVLKPIDWPRRTDTLHRLLAPLEDENAVYNALVTYGYEEAKGIRFVNKIHDLELSPEEIEAESLLNLADEEVQQHIVPMEEFKVILCDSNYFAAEKILDVQLMQSLQAQLETDLIVVSIPRRGILLAANGLLPDESLMKFAQMGIFTYIDDEPKNPPISPLVYMVQDGEIVGFLNLDMPKLIDKLKIDFKEAKKEQAAGAPINDAYIKVTPADDPTTGKKMVLIIAGGTNVTELEIAIRHAILGVHSHIWQNFDYSGTYKVILLHSLTPDTDAVRDMMDRIMYHFNESDPLKLVTRPEQTIPLFVQIVHSIDAIEPDADDAEGEAAADE